MARYIDADKLMAYIYGLADKGNPIYFVSIRQLKSAIAFLEEMYPADVAPKSEVDKLVEVNADLNESLRLAAEANKDLQVELAAMRTAANSYKMHYESLAREIFEEVEKLFVRFDNKTVDGEKARWDMIPVRVIKYSDFEELKKKYTEPDAE